MGCKLFMSHSKWSIFKLSWSLMSGCPGCAQFGIGEKGITSVWKYGRTPDEGFPKERDYPFMLHLKPWRKYSVLTGAPTHTHFLFHSYNPWCQIYEEKCVLENRPAGGNINVKSIHHLQPSQQIYKMNNVAHNVLKKNHSLKSSFLFLAKNRDMFWILFCAFVTTQDTKKCS